VSPEENPYAPPRSDDGAGRLTPEQIYAPPMDGPRGIGGWLVLPLIALVITPFRVAVTSVRDFSEVLKPEVWAALTTPGGPSYHPLWMPIIVFELLMNLALIGGTIWLLVLFLKKSRRVPTLMVIWIAASIGIQVIDLLLMQLIPALAAQAEPPADLVRGVISAAIWIPYFLSSKRVKNTFVR
jgi:Protein of unknown function (DUF2569)